MTEDPKLNSTIHYAIETAIRLGFLILLLAWCFQILYPFAGVIMWGVILALATAPLYDALNAKFGNKPKLTSAIIIISGLLILLIPSWLFLDSMVTGVKEISKSLDAGTLTIPLPPEKVASWPVIGDVVFDTWKLASENLESAIIKYKDQVTAVAGALFEGVLSMGGSILQFIVATIIAGILLATKGTDHTAKRFFNKLVGVRGNEFADVTATIVRNVTKGVLGVALIQSVLVGIGFLLAGVPYAGLWALLVLILAILQLPPLLVILPVIVYLFSATTVVPATLWTIYLLLAGASDNILKPILLGKGAPVPMLVIFLGVIGGFMLSGFMGLFTGAIVISLGYKMFLTWLNDAEDKIETDS